MKTVTAPLAALFAVGGPFTMADLYTIHTSSGAVLRWADFDSDIVHPVNGFTYSSSGPVVRRGKTRVVIGVEVDTLDVSIFPRSTDQLNGISILAAAQAGAFDGASLTLERCFMASGAAVGVTHQFLGRFADLTISRTEMQCRVNSGTEVLATQLPRNLYQAGCIHTLYDVGCGLTRASWGIASTVASGSTRTGIICGLAQSAGWFDRGYIQFTSGALSGLRQTVKNYVPSSVGLFASLPSAPAIGDTFTAYPGCDKAQLTCSGKFNNLPQFRGFPYIPVPETAW